MRRLLGHVLTRGRRARRSSLLLAVSSLAALAAASPALASQQLNEEFAQFADCPLAMAEVCTVANTTSGEFVMGSKTVSITKAITLQGGLLTTSSNLIPAADGNTLSKTTLTIPGGLLGVPGLEVIGGEVTATTEIAGPPTGVMINRVALLSHTGIAVTLPIKVKLDNQLLGSECYIGSDAEPVLLRLTTGTTSPPAPNQPISGKFGSPEGQGKGKIIFVKENTLVDNLFSVPGVHGCGESGDNPLIDQLVDLDAGLPSAAGKNTAILNGTVAEAPAEFARKHIKVKKAKKEKAPKKEKA